MIQVFPDYETLSHGAAELFVRQAKAASRDGRRFSVALSGGRTPRRAYELLALPPFRDQVDWSRVHIFWGDERCAPPDSPLSNYGMARLAFLNSVPVPSSRIHPILCAKSPKSAALEYEAMLRSFFGDNRGTFDLIFLGLGEDGHTASLFPGTSIVEEQVRWAGEMRKAREDISRVSLTLPVINRASVVAFIVSGPSKSKILRQALNRHHSPVCLPAQLVQPSRYGGDLHWLVDESAASLLER
jgi:6-phosphogluconolactonase